MSDEPTINSILIPLVNSTRALPGWTFAIIIDTFSNDAETDQYELQITVRFADSYHPESERGVTHCFLVPRASYDFRAWRWWLFQQCLLVQQHELAEFFRQITHESYDPRADEIEFKPFRPHHAAGRNPYQVLEVGTEEDAQAAPGSR